jgi:hypothetical protein
VILLNRNHIIVDPLISALRFLLKWRLLPNFIRKKLRSLVFPRYDGVKLHEIIKEEVGGKLLSDALTNVIIPTFDIKLFKPIIFSSLKVIDSS